MSNLNFRLKIFYILYLMDNNFKKKTIHFILPGGGVKGAFQAGFIYRLIDKYYDLFEVFQIDCTSVGALNGMALISEKQHALKLKDIWLSINDRSDIFGDISKSVVFNSMLSHYYSVNNKGLFTTSPLKKKIDKFYKLITDNNKKKTFNCTVLNINSGKTEYINGANDNLNEYILASASVWILAPPVIINGKEYADGGIHELYPVKLLKNSEADLKIIVGYSDSTFDLSGDSGEHIYSYLNRIISISNHTYNMESVDIINSVDTLKIHHINYDVNPFDFNPEYISDTFNYGVNAADNFFKEHLVSSNLSPPA